MKTLRVKTWKERPARPMMTPAFEEPWEEVDMAPPAAWSTKEIMSQGMKRL